MIDRTDPNFLLSTMDANEWATEFCKRFPSMDHGTMLGWFANSIMTGYDEANRRAVLQASAEQDAQQFLQPDDLATLHRFMDFCTDSDSGGYSIPKERMQRLAEIGAIESKGFGRYQVTTFGLYVLTMDADGSANLPLKTYAEYDADCMAAHEAKIFGGAASNATREVKNG